MNETVSQEMAQVTQDKSRGLKFAEQQLLRHGWEHGKGLGRAENGISEAIKVKVKCDKGGVGHKEGEQFTFHWWDHVFNKASSNLQVESDPNGVQLKKVVEKDEDGMISNKKPRKATLAKEKLYGCFVKSATLLSGQEQPEPSNADDSSSSSSEEEEDHKLDLSSTIKLSDADLMKACGGRTAHKGARHGLTMSAKLARLEQQEAEFMAKYAKKNEPARASPAPAVPTSQSADSERKRKKKSGGSVMELNGVEMSESPETDGKPEKKKKKVSGDAEEIAEAVSTEQDVICGASGGDFYKTKRKQKKKKNHNEQNEEERTASPAAENPEETAELHTDTKVKKKKKKKSSQRHNEPAVEKESKDTESNQSELVHDCVPKTKKKKSAALLEETDVAAKHKKKKCKKDKHLDMNKEVHPPQKKKKKKSKE